MYDIDEIPDDECECGVKLVTEGEQEGRMCKSCLDAAVATLVRQEELWKRHERGEITLQEFFDLA
jgi:hypothetical protein